MDDTKVRVNGHEVQPMEEFKVNFEALEKDEPSAEEEEDSEEEEESDAEQYELNDDDIEDEEMEDGNYKYLKIRNICENFIIERLFFK